MARGRQAEVGAKQGRAAPARAAPAGLSGNRIQLAPRLRSGLASCPTDLGVPGSVPAALGHKAGYQRRSFPSGHRPPSRTGSPPRGLDRQSAGAHARTQPAPSGCPPVPVETGGPRKKEGGCQQLPLCPLWTQAPPQPRLGHEREEL